MNEEITYIDGIKFIKVNDDIKFVEEPILKERLLICSICPRMKEDVCLECGCITKIKAGLVENTCPIGKW